MDKDNSGRNDVDWTAVNEAMSDIFKPPRGLAERIKAAVDREAVHGKAPEISVRSPDKYKILLGWAASAAVVCILTALVVSLEHVSGRNTTVNAEENSVAAKSYRLDIPLLSEESGHNEKSGSMPVRLAGVSSSGESSGGGAHRRVRVASAVRHVWLVPDMDRADALLRHIAEENEKNISVPEKKNGNIVYSVCLKDTELQNLVNMLYSEGWSLVTPDYPQPREENNAVFSGRGVNYEICIVKK